MTLTLLKSKIPKKEGVCSFSSHLVLGSILISIEVASQLSVNCSLFKTNFYMEINIKNRQNIPNFFTISS